MSRNTESEYLGSTTLDHSQSGEEITVMLTEDTDESSPDSVFTVSLHSENQAEHTYTVSSKWFINEEQAKNEFLYRVELLKDTGWTVRRQSED